jgi:hypothetical protein
MRITGRQGQNMNPVPPEYAAVVLTIRPRRWVEEVGADCLYCSIVGTSLKWPNTTIMGAAA